MQQATHTAINWLSRQEVQNILETVCGTAVYDDEPTDDLRDCLREMAEGQDSFSDTVRAAIGEAP